MFPNSFFACDIFTGFEHMDVLLRQQAPQIVQGAAFCMVFGLEHFVSLTFRKHWRIYDLNQDMVPKFQQLGRTPEGTWKMFVHDAMEVVKDSEQEQEINSEGDEAQLDKAKQEGHAAADSEQSDERGMPDSLDKLPSGASLVVTPRDTGLDWDSDAGCDWGLCCPYCNDYLPVTPSDNLRTLCQLLDSKSIFDGANGLKLPC